MEDADYAKMYTEKIRGTLLEIERLNATIDKCRSDLQTLSNPTTTCPSRENQLHCGHVWASLPVGGPRDNNEYESICSKCGVVGLD
jgi:hypothetical protein